MIHFLNQRNIRLHPVRFAERTKSIPIDRLSGKVSHLNLLNVFRYASPLLLRAPPLLPDLRNGFVLETFESRGILWVRQYRFDPRRILPIGGFTVAATPQADVLGKVVRVDLAGRLDLWEFPAIVLLRFEVADNTVVDALTFLFTLSHALPHWAERFGSFLHVFIQLCVLLLFLVDTSLDLRQYDVEVVRIIRPFCSDIEWGIGLFQGPVRQLAPVSLIFDDEGVLRDLPLRRALRKFIGLVIHYNVK